MASTRQESRARPSRSRQTTSNKENICPLQSSGSTRTELPHRRSPLPEGFPRSPLQDITHIICPNNIWPADEDLLTDQVRKKFRKDSSAESCVALASNETIQQKAVQQQCNSSWKGLSPCLNFKSETKLAQTEVITKEIEGSKNSTDVEVEANTSKIGLQKHAAGLCIYRDNVLTDVIDLKSCDIEHGQDVKSDDLIKQTGELDTKALLIKHRNIVAENCSNLRQSIGSQNSKIAVGKENQSKRPQQSAQSKKKSNLLMLR